MRFYFILLIFILMISCAQNNVRGNRTGDAIVDLVNFYKDRIDEEKYSVTIDNIVAQGKNTSSEFSQRLYFLIKEEMDNCKFLDEYPRGEYRQRIIEEQLQSTSDFYASDGPSPIGHLGVLDGIFKITYFVREKDILIYSELLKLKTGQNLGTFSGIIPKERFSGVAMAPSNAGFVSRVADDFSLENENVDLRVEISTDKGKGGVYALGERMQIYFKANQDCYIKIYHISSNKEMQLIYPSEQKNEQVKKNYFYRVPTQFETREPLGAEIIKAIVSKDKFEKVEKAFGVLDVLNDNGVILPKIKNNATKTRGLIPVQSLSEDICFYTIVRKKQ